MTEIYPTDSQLNDLSGTTDTEQEVLFIPAGESPYYTSFYKMLYRLMDVARRAGDLRVYKDGELTFGVRAGRFMDGDTVRNYAGAAEQSLTNNATNYVYLTADATLTVNTTGFPVPSATPHIPLATIATSGGEYDLDDITDYRGRAIFSIIGAAGGNINALDWQESVLDELDFTAAEPAAPSVGDRYLNTGSGASSQTGQTVAANDIEVWNGTNWTEITPTEGACTLVQDRDMLIGFNGSSWVDLGTFANIKDLTDGGNADALHVHDTAGITNAAVTKDKLNADVAGNGLIGGAGSALAIQFDSATLGITGDTLHIKDGGVAATQLAAAVAGDGIQGGAGSALAVDVSDFAGEGLEDDGAENLRVKLDGPTLARSASGIKVDAVPRANLTEDTLAVYQIPLMNCRTGPGNTMTSNGGAGQFKITSQDMGGSGGLILYGNTANGETKADNLSFEFAVPPEYVADADMQLVVNCHYVVTGTVGTKTIDAEVWEMSDSGASPSDRCATALQTITASAADYTFTITDTTLAPGDRLKIIVAMVIQETGGMDDATGQINSIRLKMDIKG